MNPVSFALLGALLMIAAHVAGRASRDALFLSYFDATDLPKVMIGSALFSIAGAFALSHWLGRSGPARVVPIAFGVSALLLVGEWGVMVTEPRLGAVVLYLHIALFGAALISGFWSVVNERFDPHVARRTIGRITAAAAAGGVVGGLAAERLTSLFGLPAMLLFMAGLHALCALSVRGLGAPVQTRRAQPAVSVAEGIRSLRHNRYLHQMMILVALVAATDTLLDYAVKYEADARFDRGPELVRFFALFYTATGILGFLLQASLGSQVLRRLGLGVAMLSYPALVIATGLVSAGATRLWSVALTRGMGMVAANSLFRSGFELLYTPLAPSTKRPTKIFVDIGAQRGGDLVTSGAILLALALLPELPVSLVVGTAIACAVGVLLAVRTLERGYVRQLATSLREGKIAFDDPTLLDATTARTIVATGAGLDRHQILEMIRARQPGEAETVATEELPAQDVGSVAEQIDALHSADAARVRSTLRARGTDPRLLLAHVVPLLEGDLADAAAEFLRRAAPMTPGQIVDWLLDPSLSGAVRLQLAGALEDADDARALDGLLRLLESPTRDFDLRYRAAQSAARIVGRDESLAPPAPRVEAIAARELNADAATWERQGRRAPGSEASVLLEGPSLRRINRSIEQVFTVLGLAGEREVLASTLVALYGPDPNLRGTALEYLELTLPPELGAALRPRLERAPQVQRPRRPRTEIADELLRSGLIDRDRLKS
jgi:hypothetical protein